MEGNAKDTVIVTGASGSVGAAATRALAGEGWHVILACRNEVKGKAVMDAILHDMPQASLELMLVDMSSLDSVQRFAQQLEGRTIHALFNNAGIMKRHYAVTVDGYEETMAVNYLATALLTHLVIPLMPAGGHIVNMVSLTTRFAHMDLNWQQWTQKDFGQLSTYGSSKLALLLHTIALAKDNPHLYVNVSDPGVVNSGMITMGRWYDPLADIFFRPFIKTPEQGAVSSLNALKATTSNMYYVGDKAKDMPQRFLASPLITPLFEQMSKFFSRFA